MTTGEEPDLLRHNFEFASDGLTVAYRASERPQQISILATVSRDHVPLRHDFLYWLCLTARVGMIGGTEFAPEKGTMKVIKDFGKGKASQFSGVLEVSSMSPLFVRNIVNSLVFGPDMLTLSISGELAPNGDDLSVDTPKFMRWLDDRDTAFVGRWPDLGFEVRETSIDGKMKLSLQLREPAKQAHVDMLDLVLAEWGAAMVQYPRRDRRTYGSMQIDSRIARTKREIRVGKSQFAYIRKPAADLLLNGLSAMNRAGELPIESVDLAL